MGDGSEFGEIRPVFREFQPQWGVVLGSGLRRFVDAMAVSTSVPFAEVHGLPRSSVPGHAGRFVLGELGGMRLLVAQGRVHLYEGYAAREVTAFVRFMSVLGVQRVALTNAAGTLNPGFAPGTWMMLSDHLNLTGVSPLTGEPLFVDLTDVYSAKWRARFSEGARAEAMTLHEGVYAGLPGPQYETPAEIRMLRTLGADAVGMSTVLEAIQARALGVEVAAFSCLTNWAAGLGSAPLSHAEVLESGERTGAVLANLLASVLRER